MEDSKLSKADLKNDPVRIASYWQNAFYENINYGIESDNTSFKYYFNLEQSIDLLLTLSAYTGQPYDIEPLITAKFIEGKVPVNDFTLGWPTHPHLRQNEAYTKLNSLIQVK